MADVNRLVEPDTKPLCPKNENAGIRYIMWSNFMKFYVLLFGQSGAAGLDAARSETTVAGLGLVLAFLQPERKCVCRL